MKKYIKKIVRFISVKPVVGRPIRILVAIVRLPQMRDMVFDINHQINGINHQINDINHQINDINHQINSINHQINSISHQLHTLNEHQHLFNTEYLPSLIESLNYQENLKKSLPVVLRQQERKLRELEN